VTQDQQFELVFFMHFLFQLLILSCWKMNCDEITSAGLVTRSASVVHGQHMLSTSHVLSVTATWTLFHTHTVSII